MFTEIAYDLASESPNTDTATSPSNSVDSHIGSRLRIRRTSRGMNGAQFSKLVGVDRSNLAAYEAGAQRINAGLLLRIRRARRATRLLLSGIRSHDGLTIGWRWPCRKPSQTTAAA